MRTPSVPRWALGAAWLLTIAAALRGQEQLVVVGPEPARVRLGDTALAEIRIVDPQGTPRALELPNVDGLRMQLAGPSQYSEFRSDGVRSTQRVTVSWSIEIQPSREGTFVVPPITLWTGSKEQTTRPLQLVVVKDLQGEANGWIDVQVEPRRVYVHEPIRVHVEAGVREGQRLVQKQASNGQGYLDVEVQASWLDEFPGGEAIELPAPRGTTVPIVIGNRAVTVQAEEGHRRGDGTWLRLAFDRAFLPTRVGTIQLAAPTFRYHVVRREGQRDIFGLSRGGQSEQFFAHGKPVTIEVLPIPEAGRPTPYYGAVGRFTIDAVLDRDTVKQGGSVKLTLTVRGQGNLEFLRVPALDDVPGFHKLGQAEARRDSEKVVVTYDLTPLSTDVREVPAIGWNYFDTTPGVERFVDVATRPLPLTVTPLANGESLAPLPEAAPRAVTPGVDDVFDLPSLDGAPVALVRPPVWLAWLVLLGPWCVVAAVAALLGRQRRARADVAGQRARRAARACAAALADGGDPLAAFAGYLGDRLGVPAAAVIAPDLAERLQRAGLDAEEARDVAHVVERFTNARYGGGEPLPPALVQEWVDRLERRKLTVGGGGGGGGGALLPLLLAVAAGLGAAGDARAQAPSPEHEAVQLYRAGDHRAAEAAFARAFAASGDRRLLQARGNCWFRLGDLPRALWAYESARLALPRDPELAANLALVRARLQVGEDADGLGAQLARVRSQLTVGEQLAIAALLLGAAALLLVFGWRRIGLRWLGGLLVVPALWLVLPRLLGGGEVAPLAIALDKLPLVSEPRAGLEPVATVRAGVGVEVLGGRDGAFVRVRAGDRVGFAPREQLGIVE